MSEINEQAEEETTSDALYTVVAGEGDGFLLGLAAGDSAGGAWDLGYSAITEQATVISYELIAGQELDHTNLREALLELDGLHEEEPVYRAETPAFRIWLDRARAGSPVPGEEPALDAAARSLPLGVVYRREPETLVTEAARLGRLFHRDAGTIASGVISAAAVAASCFAQSGLDLVAGVGETIELGIDELVSGADGTERIARLPDEIRALLPAVGVTTAAQAVAAVEANPDEPLGDDPVKAVLAGLLLAAPVVPRHHVAISEAAGAGGSLLGAVVGSVVGARVGIRAWPWAFANDTWFAEIGRRLVRGPSEVRDLPIPYAVEQHLMSGGRPGFH